MQREVAPQPIVLLALSLFAALGLSGCGGDEPDPSADDSFQDSLQLNADGRVIEANVRDDALISGDAESGEYVFDSRVLNDAGVNIEVGNVVLIAEQALIRVTSTTLRGTDLVVSSEPATLPELVDGTLSWNLPLGGGDQPLPTLLIGGEEVAGVRKNGSIDYSADVGGFKLSLSFTPTSSRNEFSVQMTIDKGVEPAVEFRASAIGRVSGFRHLLDVAMSGGRTNRWNFSVRNLDLELEVQMAGANTGNASLAELLPSPFSLRIPIPTVLPLGLNIEVSFAFTATLELPGLFNASSQVSATYRYGGDAGFNFEGATLQADGATTADSIELSEPNTAATQGPASVSIGIGPRYSLNALLDQVSARIETRYILVGNLRGDALSGFCIESGVQQSVVGVATAGFFGISLGEVSHEFYSKFDSKETGDCSP